MRTYASQRRLLEWLLLIAVAIVGILYRSSFTTIVQKWIDDTAYSHGFLILPLSLWLAWQQRQALAAVNLRPSWLGVVALLGCAVLWLVSRGAGVLGLEQFAVVAMAPALVLAIWGWPAARVLMFALAFLFFAVPFGRALVPWLMQWTADLATLLLQGSGVPVLRSHMQISIPAGSFEVARACSGLNYFITGLVLGVLYAFLTYRSWSKRLLCVVAFVLIPVLANGLRVYFTILVSHLTDMRFGPGVEHVTFGRIFFILVVLLMFWVGRRWHDAAPTLGPGPTAASATPALISTSGWTPALLAFAILLLTPPYLQSFLEASAHRVRDTAELAVLPQGRAGWQGPVDGEGWRPDYAAGLVERRASYVAPGGGEVGVFVAVYGLGASGGTEMISYRNVLYSGEHGSLAEVHMRRIDLGDGRSLKVREVMVPSQGGMELVWHWFVVGDRPSTNEFVVKAREALAVVMRNADTERVITLSTPLNDGASARLNAFAVAHSDCIAGGFEPTACGT